MVVHWREKLCSYFSEVSTRRTTVKHPGAIFALPEKHYIAVFVPIHFFKGHIIHLPARNSLLPGKLDGCQVDLTINVIIVVQRVEDDLFGLISGNDAGSAQAYL